MNPESNGNGDTSSGIDDVIDGEIITDSLFEDDQDFNWFGGNSSLKSSDREAVKTEIKAKSGPPTGDEWLDFFSRVVVRLGTDFYIDMAFRDVDEDLLSDREVARIHLDQVERDRIARPFAEFSLKNKFLRKHGRSIVSTAGSLDSIIQLGMWINRVNRIAAKYRELDGGPVRPRRRGNASVSVSAPVYAPARPVPTNDAEGGEHERSGEASQNGRVRPTIAGEVFNSFGG